MTEPSILAGRYRLGRLLGRGGMGAVYEAHDNTLDRDVAVKLLELRGNSEAGPAIERFRREAKILAGLSHPNIVTVFDFGDDAGRAWLVMRLLPGPTLQQLVERRGRLPVDAAERYTRNAAAALAAAHAAGIVHRDIKPGNLMLAPDGSCSLVDLGIARLASETQSDSGLTQPGTILGTVQYVAPEVVSGQAPGPPADVYALGVALYVMLIGRPPFDAGDMVATMGQHVNAPVPPPRSLRGDVPPGLDRLCLSMLAKNPDQRPTAGQVAAALGDSQTAARATAAGAAAAATTVAMGAPAAAAAGTQLIPPGPPTGTPAPPPEEPASPRGWLIAAGVLAALIALALIVFLLTRGNGGSPEPTTPPPTTPKTSGSSSQSNSSSSSSSSSSSNSSGSSDSSPPPSTDQPSDSSGPDQGQIQQALNNVDDAVQSALPNIEKPPDQNKLQKAYDDLERDVNGGDTNKALMTLDNFDRTVDDLYNSDALNDDDYNALMSTSDELRQALGG